jgi:hypothetical protein
METCQQMNSTNGREETFLLSFVSRSSGYNSRLACDHVMSIIPQSVLRKTPGREGLKAI